MQTKKENTTKTKLAVYTRVQVDKGELEFIGLFIPVIKLLVVRIM